MRPLADNNFASGIAGYQLSCHAGVCKILDPSFHLDSFKSRFDLASTYANAQLQQIYIFLYYH